MKLTRYDASNPIEEQVITAVPYGPINPSSMILVTATVDREVTCVESCIPQRIFHPPLRLAAGDSWGGYTETILLGEIARRRVNVDALTSDTSTSTVLTSSYSPLSDPFLPSSPQLQLARSRSKLP